MNDRETLTLDTAIKLHNDLIDKIQVVNEQRLRVEQFINERLAKQREDIARDSSMEAFGG